MRHAPGKAQIFVDMIQLDLGITKSARSAIYFVTSKFDVKHAKTFPKQPASGSMAMHDLWV